MWKCQKLHWKGAKKRQTNKNKRKQKQNIKGNHDRSLARYKQTDKVATLSRNTYKKKYLKRKKRKNCAQDKGEWHIFRKSSLRPNEMRRHRHNNCMNIFRHLLGRVNAHFADFARVIWLEISISQAAKSRRPAMQMSCSTICNSPIHLIQPAKTMP